MLYLIALMSLPYSAFAKDLGSEIPIGGFEGTLKALPELWRAPISQCLQALFPPLEQQALNGCQKALEKQLSSKLNKVILGSYKDSLTNSFEIILWSIKENLNNNSISPPIEGHLNRIGSLSNQILEELQKIKSIIFTSQLRGLRHWGRWHLGLSQAIEIQWKNNWEIYTSLGISPQPTGVTTTIKGPNPWTFTFHEAWVKHIPNRYFYLTLGKLPPPQFLINPFKENRQWPFVGGNFNFFIFENKNLTLKTEIRKEHFRQLNSGNSKIYNMEHSEVGFYFNWRKPNYIFNNSIKLNWFGDGQKILPRSYFQNLTPMLLNDMADPTQSYRILQINSLGQIALETQWPLVVTFWAQWMRNTFHKRKPVAINEGLGLLSENFIIKTHLLRIEKSSLPPLVWPWFISSEGIHWNNYFQWSPKFLSYGDFQTSLSLAATHRAKSKTHWLGIIDFNFNCELPYSTKP